MSNAVFPLLPGLSIEVTKTPTFSTITARAVSGRELRVSTMPFPVWEINLSFNVLRAGQGYSEFQSLLGFFLNRQGSFDSFLFFDPTDNLATQQPFGIADGTTKDFQLVRALGGFAEPCENIAGTPTIYFDGVVTSADYEISNTGVVRFADAPSSNVHISWTGNYYYRCRFDADDVDFDRFLQDLWRLKKCRLIGAVGNKV